MRWPETSWLYSSGSSDRPLITPGRSADEAWALAKEEKAQDGQTDRQTDAGALAEVRWEGADGTGDSLRYAPLTVITHIMMERWK